MLAKRWPCVIQKNEEKIIMKRIAKAGHLLFRKAMHKDDPMLSR